MEHLPLPRRSAEIRGSGAGRETLDETAVHPFGGAWCKQSQFVEFQVESLPGDPQQERGLLHINTVALLPYL